VHLLERLAFMHRRESAGTLRAVLIDFFMAARSGGVPVSLREYLDLLEALNARAGFADSMSSTT
jgi:hypothetical protein